MEEKRLFIDPRTKIFLLLMLNIIMLNTDSGDILLKMRIVIGFLPTIMLMTAARFRPALIYSGIYIVSYLLIWYVLDYTGGFVTILLGFITSMCVKFLPGGMMGVYFFASTKVNEFVAAMEKMHVSQKVIIPLSVMFRFFPTAKEEAEGISDAMRMRKLGFSYFFTKPVEVLEYSMVPLMISVVNIGDDLSASALTRCLGQEKDRTNISKCGFGLLDLLLFLLGLTFIAIYILEKGGVI